MYSFPQKKTELAVPYRIRGFGDGRMGEKGIVIQVLRRDMGIRNDLTCLCCSRESFPRFIVRSEGMNICSNGDSLN